MTHHNVSGSEALMAGLCTNCEGAWGPLMKCEQVLDKSGFTRVRCVAWLKKIWRKRIMKRKMKESW